MNMKLTSRKLVVQMPALNEGASIEGVLTRIPKTLPGILKIECLVIDDGSSDDTAALARTHGAIVVSHAKPRGVGAAFRTGIQRSLELGADIVVTIDADGQFNPEDIAALVAPILADETDFVTASRFSDPSMAPVMPRTKRWGNDVLARWISRLTGQDFRDVSCGFRAYSKNAFMRLNLLGDFTYTHEVFLSLAFAGLRIREIPVVVRGVREHGQSRVAANVFGYAWRAASIVLRTYRDYQPLKFFGALAAILAGISAVVLGLVGGHWLLTGAITPYKAFAFIGGTFLGAALLVYLVGLLAEMQVRIRTGLEDVLFRVRRLESRAIRDEHRTPAD